MRLTSGKFLEILNSIDPDPQLLAKIVVDTMKRMPSAYAWQLSQQLYMEYFYDGPTIIVTNNLTGVVRRFANEKDILVYLNNLGYKCDLTGVKRAVTSRAVDYNNHKFEPSERKEITYFE